MKALEAKKLYDPEPKLVKVPRGMEIWPMSRNMLMKAAREAGALVHYGRSVFINVTIMNEFFDSISGAE